MTTFVPAKTLVVDWLNASTLTGRGHVLPGGVHVREPRSPGVGAYAVVTVIASTPDRGQATLHTSRLSITVRSGQHGAAETAAVAVANLLAGVVDGPPVVLPGAVLQEVTGINGPTELVQFDRTDAYLIDADYLFQPIES